MSKVRQLTMDIDPVCRMQIESVSPFHSVHRGISYTFCSEQCLDAFQENAELYVGLHHSEGASAIIKERHIRLRSLSETEKSTFIESLRSLMGLLVCEIDVNGLHLVYDLKQLNWVQIERLAISSGIWFGGAFGAFRRAVWRFTERNELKNLAHWSDPTCCNHPPTGTK